MDQAIQHDRPDPEFGSGWHLLYPARNSVEASPPPLTQGLLVGSGRAALLALYDAGRLSASRLWVPDYFCPWVLEFWAEFAGEIRTYPFGPWQEELQLHEIPAEAGDTVLLVNTLGLFGAPDVASLRRRGIQVVEDHTHDPFSPWALQSAADWCIASLHKSLPLPDGGLVWSPAAHALPEAPPLLPEHELAALRILASMAFKNDYLQHGFPPKTVFRELYLAGESYLGHGPVSAASPATTALLAGFPHAAWRQRRLENWRRLADALNGVKAVQVVKPKHSQAVPFRLVLTLDNETARDRLRALLQARRLYTAILWSLTPGKFKSSVAALSFGSRHLAVPCDARYGKDDIAAIARLLREAIDEI